ncbi:MAG: ribonuclease M5 [Peptoniphilaceae bacterium]|nr:ribonuclease M5 [Peptoniphilaceae bacterium]MDD7383834.1 ribonuclease M5 [Peptoniphilaceae bacterium]MDY3737589.1 ribonuclease M5 [Peptoniphilaceae bacterium]
MKIKETIVVEGKDDISNVKSAIDCECVATGGYYFGEKFLEKLKNINERTGIIIFTDPDYAGKRIREKILEKIPNAKEAFLDRDKATKKNDIGIENASKEDIIDALKKAKANLTDKREEFTLKDLIDNGLYAGDGSLKKRVKLGQILGIGYSNSKQLLKRLNSFMITREEFKDAVKKL